MYRRGRGHRPLRAMWAVVVVAVLAAGCGESNDSGAQPVISLRLEASDPGPGDGDATDTDDGGATDGGDDTGAGQGDGGDDTDEGGEGGDGAGGDGGGGTTVTRPDWLGSRPLPTNPDGSVVPQTTPEELIDRQFPTIDTLPPPDDDLFESTIGPLTGDPLARSTWEPECPVTVEELSYITVSFWGFDGEAHTGEMIVNASVAEDVVGVFEALYEARFPIEEMRIATRADLDAAPTGDGNMTTAFVCRQVVGGNVFSQHAFGLAVDINPFQNPYVKDDVVLPELATVYTDRSVVLPGMHVDNGPAVAAFDAIGWGWGGRWQTLKDYQHFSLNNR